MLVFTLRNLEGATGGVRLATLTYNATALPNDPFSPGWAVARSTNVTAAGAKLGGLQTVYVQVRKETPEDHLLYFGTGSFGGSSPILLALPWTMPPDAPCSDRRQRLEDGD